MAGRSSNFWETAKQIPYEPEKKSESDRFWETAKQIPYEPKRKTDPYWDTIDWEPVLTESNNQTAKKIDSFWGDDWEPIDSGIQPEQQLQQSEPKADPFWGDDWEPVDGPATIPNQPQDERSYLIDQITGILKGSAKGVRAFVAGNVGPTADMVSTIPLNTLVSIYNSLSGSEVPQFQPIGETIGQGIDKLTGGFTKPDKYDPGYAAAEAAAGAVGPMGIARLGGKIASGIASLGSTSKPVLAGAAAGGAAQEYAREGGFGTGGQIIAGFGANALTQALNPRNIAKATATAVGLGPKKFKLDDYDAGQRIGVDISADALSKSGFLGGVKKQTSKLYLANEHFTEQNRKAGEQFQTAFEKVADTVGPKFTDEVQAAQKALYDNANKFLPDSAENIFILPSNTAKTIKKVSIATDSLLGDEALDGKVIKILTKMDKSLPGEGRLPLPLQNLINSKIKLAPFIPWDAEKSNPLALVHRALNEDIAAYGKKNPEWYKAFKTADENFAQNAKRKTLDKLVEGKIEDPITKDVEYLSLAKQLEDPKHRKRIENILGQGNVHKLEDFITSAKRLAQSEKNTAFSASSEAAGAKKMFNTALAIIAGTFSTTAGVIGEVGGVGLMTYLLSSKKFLNKAADFARTPSEPLAKQLENIVKENTGYTIQALNKIYREQKN